MSNIEVTRALPKSDLTMSSGEKVVGCEFHEETEELYLIFEGGSKYLFPVPGTFSVNMHKNVKKWLADENWSYVL